MKILYLIIMKGVENILKKRCIYLIILVFSSVSLVYLYCKNINNNLNQNKITKSSEDDITMGEIEEIFRKYLDENKINIKFGTQEYFDYILEQELEPEKKDKELEKYPKYKLINLYFAEYIMAVQKGELDSPISISRFKNRTIAQIRNMNIVNDTQKK